MEYRFETFKNNTRTVGLRSPQVPHSSVIPNKLYESPKLKNWMCELMHFFTNPVTYLNAYICFVCMYVCMYVCIAIVF